MNSISYHVSGFESVTIAPGIACPACREVIGPHAMSHDGIIITLRCAACHSVVLQVEPINMDPEACDY
jgi:hypothetical protein